MIFKISRSTLRQRPRGDHQRPLQDRADQTRAAVARRRSRVRCRCWLYRLVQQPSYLRALRRYAARW